MNDMQSVNGALSLRLYDAIEARQRTADLADGPRYVADMETLCEHPTDEFGWCSGPHIEDEKAPCVVVRRLATVYPETSA